MTKSSKAIDISDEELKIVCPFRMLIAGASETGKTTLIINMIKQKHNIFSCKFNKIYYVLPEMSDAASRKQIQRLREADPNITIEYSVPDYMELVQKNLDQPCLLIIEDRFRDLANSDAFYHAVRNKIPH